MSRTGGLALLLLAGLMLSGCGGSSAADRKTSREPAVTYADSATTQSVLDTCTKLMSVYAANKYNATSASVKYEAKVRQTYSQRRYHWSVPLTVTYQTKTGLSSSVPLYCATNEDFSSPHFSPRSESDDLNP